MTVENAFNKIKCTLNDKNSEQRGHRENVSQHNKVHI